MNYMSKSYRIFRLFSAIWLILDMIFHLIQTQQYFVLSPSLNSYHEAYLNKSEKIEEMCAQLNKTEFNHTLIDEEQNHLFEKWINTCDNFNFLALQPNTSLLEPEDSIKVCNCINDIFEPRFN